MSFWKKMCLRPFSPTKLYGSFYFVCWTLRKLTGKLVKNEFFNRVLAPGTYLDRFLFKNRAESTIQISISIFLDPIRPRFAVFLDFHAFPRPKFPPVYPFSIQNTHSNLPSLILSYRNIPSFNISILDLFLPPLIRVVPEPSWTNMGPTWHPYWTMLDQHGPTCDPCDPLETYWKHIGNILGTYCEHIGNILENILETYW